jgi:glycosyltransferase involved in cell wall biosynthesis
MSGAAAGAGRPRWLVIAEEPFLPADAGGRVETTNFLSAAHAAGVDLRVLIPTKEPLDEARYAALLPGASIVGLPRDPSALAHLSRAPYVQASRPTAPLERALAVTPPMVDAVISYSTRVAHLGELVAQAWGIPHMVRSYNIETEYFRVLAGRTSGPRSAAYRVENLKMRRAEAAMHTSRYVTVIADISREDHVWRSERATVRTIHLPPFLPLPAASGDGRTPADGGRIPDRVLFAGSLDTPTNTEALRWFLSAAWPSLLRLRPAATLQVVGRRASAELLGELRSHPRVTVEVDVPEMAPYLAAASASINPMRSGSGVNIKMVDAMSAGVPVVSTAVGSRGMHWEPGRDLLVADDPEGFARAVARLLDDPAHAASVAEAGRAFVVRELDWATLIRQVREELHGAETPARSTPTPATEPAAAAERTADNGADDADEAGDAGSNRVRGPFEPRTPVF